MKAFTLSAISTLFAGLTLAHPVDLLKRQSFSQVDITILQFALTLEHLENDFYRSAMASFTQQHFIDAGFSQDFFLNMQFIAADEAAHVQLLQVAIQSAGVVPVSACQYNFPVTDVQSFVTLSAVLESVGTSAYLGAAPFVGSRDVLAIAASIMAVEGFHTSLQRTSIGAIGAPDPFTTPLGANAVFTLASQFIVSCPPTNPPLPFTAFPALRVDGAQSCMRENAFEGVGVAPPQGQAPPPAYSINAASSVTEAYVAQVTEAAESVTESAAAETTAEAVATESAVASETTAEAVATETAVASETTAEAAATETAVASETTAEAAPAEPSMAMMKRQNSLGCTAPFAGGSMNLIPDFGASTRDFTQIVQIFVTFISGLQVISIAATIINGGINIIIPTGIGGQVFIFITIINITGGRLSDSDILFGPAIMEVAPAIPQIAF